MPSLHTPAYRHLRERLKAARVERRLTQAQAAKATGISRRTISNMETGLRRVDATELAIFARAYRKPFGYFVIV